MKHAFKALPPAIAAVVALVSILVYFNQPQERHAHAPESATTVPTALADTSTGQAALFRSIASHEYRISWDETEKSYQSPNRRHNLRAYYRPGKLTIQNRMDSTGNNFRLRLINRGIFADGQPIGRTDLAADVKPDQNRVGILHDAFSEEFINDESGIRQNFIVRKAPQQTRKLEVRLDCKGLIVKNGGANELLFFTDHQPQEPRLIYRDLRCWDARNQPLVATLTCVDQQVRIHVNVEKATFPVTIDPLFINPANAAQTLEANQADAWFGFSVASAGDVNGDGYSEIIAGAPLFDNGQSDEGAAFLFYGSANGTTTVPTILECNQTNAQMGFAVSSAGDINKDGFSDIAIGAPNYDNGQTDEGAVFVYLGSAKGIKPNPAAVLEQHQEDAQLGTAVALAGDINADGYSDIIAGAKYFHQGQMNEGAALLYYGGVNGISSNAFSVLESNVTGARLGSSVAGAGDVNGDGFSDIVAGAILYGNGQTGEGAAFLCYGSITGLNTTNPVVIESNQTHARLGKAVAGAGDVNGDGYSDVALAASYFDNGQSDEGAVLVHYGSATGIQTNASLVLESDLMDAELGTSVSSAGDVNGDGYADLLVGTRYWGKGQLDEGATLIYHGASPGLKSKPDVVIKGTQLQSHMGSALASAGDVNGDGYSDIVTGAYLFDKGQKNEGIISVYHGAAGKLATGQPSSLTSSQAMSRYGYAIAAAGDLNGDGYDDVIVGAPHYDNGQTAEGAAFIYLGTGHGISKNFAAMLGLGQPEAEFGGAVAGAGDVNGDGFIDVIVGAMHFDNGQDEEGAAFIYLGSASGVNTVPVAILESDKTGSWMGSAVSAAGDLDSDGFGDIIVGAMNYSNGESEEGALYIYPGSPAGPSQAGMKIVESDQTNARLGNSVANAGDVNGDGYGDIVAGAYAFEDDDRGAAFVYHGGASGLVNNAALAIKGTQPYAQIGWDVSGAGDINADGYGDIVIGSQSYDSGDGAAFVYYGSATGIDIINFTSLFSHNPGMGAGMGTSVSGAGDTNGDGYSDIVIGAPWFVNEQTSVPTGQVLLFTGSESGIQSSPEVLAGNANDTYDFFGWSVSGAGDINADGYSDIMVGSPNFNSSQIDADAAHVYYGNTGAGLQNNLRLYNSDLSSLLDQSQKTKSDFGVGLYAKSFLGGNKGKLVWETKANGMGFSKAANDLITNSTQCTAMQKYYATLGLSGSELKNLVLKEGASTQVRVRVKYDPVLALTGQTYGPWRYLSAYLLGNGAAPVPEEVAHDLAETISNRAKSSEIEKWKTGISVFPNPTTDELHIRHSQSKLVRSMKLLAANGQVMIESSGDAFKMNVKGIMSGSYILIIHYADGSLASERIVIR
nr:FG-GAP-like repeat-containing protein [uncultured Dyadobacter sp.]